MSLSRRQMIAGSGAAIAWSIAGASAAFGPDRKFAFALPDSEWRKRLSPDAFAVLRREATERPGSSPLLKEHRSGTFVCAGCALPLFSSRTKYDSGTGWPSFWRALPGALATSVDHLLGYPRTAVSCSRCGGHLGHVFDDGPRPTGKRYCINGVALRFLPKAQAS